MSLRKNGRQPYCNMVSTSRSHRGSGTFQLRVHLPIGHIVPALLAGNTVVFKPSDETPAVGELMVDAWNAAGLPPGVLNLVQGKVETAQRLAYHSDLDGLPFTGSHGVGLELSRHFGNHPEKLLALELGGNNPLVVHDLDNIEAAVVTILQSTFITSGQRCTCGRRLILVEGPRTDALSNRLLAAADQIRIGASTELPEPCGFCGSGGLPDEDARSVMRGRGAGTDIHGAKPAFPKFALTRSDRRDRDSRCA